MNNYRDLPKEISDKIEFQNSRVGNLGRILRRKDNPHDNPTPIRSAFIRDVDKILNCPYYNRYADKTQVFSLYKNDDISRRSLHVQLVSRIARTIGKALNLDQNLIEAISLGHDLGHTPFGHVGEHVLDAIYREKTGRSFLHNVQSVRVVDKIFPLNLTISTLDGILCHNGEMELIQYQPKEADLNFEVFDKKVENCYTDFSFSSKLIPSTLEGAVVRISDIIAYLGKDRQDGERNNIEHIFNDYGIGTTNAEIINNLTVDIIENSFDKPYIKLSDNAFNALKSCKADNYAKIYNDNAEIKETARAIISKLYEKLLDDLKNNNRSSPIFTHHVEYLDKPYYKRKENYLETEKNQIVVDFIASMTDDYVVELYQHLFSTDNLNIKYKGYF